MVFCRLTFSRRLTKTSGARTVSDQCYWLESLCSQYHETVHNQAHLKMRRAKMMDTQYIIFIQQKCGDSFDTFFFTSQIMFELFLGKVQIDKHRVTAQFITILIGIVCHYISEFPFDQITFDGQNTQAVEFSTKLKQIHNFDSSRVTLWPNPLESQYSRNCAMCTG